MADQTNGIGTQTAIDKLETQQNDYLNRQQELNDQIIDTGLQKVQNDVNFQKEQYEQEAQKNAKALYTNYQQEQNQYGANAEALAAQGLANSGYAESSRVNLYNNYQSNVTSLMNEMANHKKELDLQMNQAYLDADIQKAQNLVNVYQQRMEMAMNMYQTRYTLYRDQVADEHWQAEFELQKRQLEMSQANSDRDYQLKLLQLQRS